VNNTGTEKGNIIK